MNARGVDAVIFEGDLSVCAEFIMAESYLVRLQIHDPLPLPEDVIYFLRGMVFLLDVHVIAHPSFLSTRPP